jgi:hypothetical protein
MKKLELKVERGYISFSIDDLLAKRFTEPVIPEIEEEI